VVERTEKSGQSEGVEKSDRERSAGDEKRERVERSGVEAKVREIRRRTRRRYSAEEKIRIVLEGLRGEATIAELCRREGISPNLYYLWSREFLEAGKRRLLGDTKREATSGEVTDLRQENSQLKQMLAELYMTNAVLKKSLGGRGEDPGTDL
jgi:transposase